VPPTAPAATSPAVTSTGAGQPVVDRFLSALGTFGPLVYGLDPSGVLLTQWCVGDSADGLERFVDIALDVVVGTVGVVKPQAAFYERHGWRGMRTLTRLVTSCRQAGVMVLLDAKRGDVGSTNDAYAEAYFGADAPLSVDAMTVTPYLGVAALRPFFDRADASDAAVFVVTRSSNPEGRTIQSARGAGSRPVEEEIAAALQGENERRAPGGIGPIGSVFGPNHGQPDFDLAALNALFLAPGVGAQGATPADVAACFAACPDRVLPAASRALLQLGPGVAELRAGAERLNAELVSALRV
jgi:orotidine-5'-phosphate decarboxylase